MVGETRHQPKFDGYTHGASPKDLPLPATQTGAVAIIRTAGGNISLELLKPFPPMANEFNA